MAIHNRFSKCIKQELHFISGLPRSGSTLLSAILRQNPDFYADISTTLESLVGTTIKIISEGESNLVITEAKKKLLHGIFDGYYKHLDKPVIFDCSRSNGQKLYKFGKAAGISIYKNFMSRKRHSFNFKFFENITSKNPFYTKIL